MNKAVGWSRPWIQGKSLGAQNFAPLEAWRLYTTEAWFEKHESKYMGEGTKYFDTNLLGNPESTKLEGGTNVMPQGRWCSSW